MHILLHSDDESSGATQPVEAAPDQPATTTPEGDVWWQDGDERAPSSAGVITSPLSPTSAPEDVPPSRLPVDPFVPAERGLAFAALRDIGQVRSVNQDSVFGMVVSVPRGDSDVPVGLFVVADGMGGHEGGEIASRIAIATVAREIMRNLILPSLDDAMTDSLQEIMTGAVQEANRAIWEAARAAGSDMGTTCTAVLLIGHTVYLGHVGDSRAYLVSKDGLHAITNDHSAVGRLIQLGQISAAEAREHPLRSHLYRTVGQMSETTVDYESFPIGAATHLLLCSDGLWGMIEEAEMLEAVQGHVWPQDVCRMLIDRANAAGGDDNISALVVMLPQ